EAKCYDLYSVVRPVDANSEVQQFPSARRLQHFYLVPLSAFFAEVRRPTTNDNCLQQLFHRTCTISLAKLPSKIPSGTSLLLRRWLTFPIIPAEFLRTVYRYNRADLVRILRLTAQ